MAHLPSHRGRPLSFLSPSSHLSRQHLLGLLEAHGRKCLESGLERGSWGGWWAAVRRCRSGPHLAAAYLGTCEESTCLRLGRLVEHFQGGESAGKWYLINKTTPAPSAEKPSKRREKHLVPQDVDKLTSAYPF